MGDIYEMIDEMCRLVRKKYNGTLEELHFFAVFILPDEKTINPLKVKVQDGGAVAAILIDNKLIHKDKMMAVEFSVLSSTEHITKLSHKMIRIASDTNSILRTLGISLERKDMHWA